MSYTHIQTLSKSTVIFSFFLLFHSLNIQKCFSPNCSSFAIFIINNKFWTIFTISVTEKLPNFIIFVIYCCWSVDVVVAFQRQPERERDQNHFNLTYKRYQANENGMFLLLFLLVVYYLYFILIYLSIFVFLDKFWEQFTLVRFAKMLFGSSRRFIGHRIWWKISQIQSKIQLTITVINQS